MVDVKMTLDFIRDLLDKCKSQGMQYHLITYRKGKEECANIDIFDNIEFDAAPAFLENLKESYEFLGQNYINFLAKINEEIDKQKKNSKKKKTK